MQATGPSDRDRFFLEAQWRLIEKAPEIVQGAGKELMGVAAILSGLYFAAIQLGALAVLLPARWRLVLLIPYLLWLPSFGCAWRTFRPQELRVAQDAPDATARALLDLAKHRGRWLKAAQWLLFSGLVAMVVLVFFTFWVAEEVRL